jgi:3-hydroxybutyryl-CoA dehydrogenase
MPSEIKSVAVVGGGYMGGGIAQALVLAGMPCALADVSAEAASNSVDRLITEAKKYESNGLFPAGAHDLLSRKLRAAESIEDAVADVDYVTEAVPEVLTLKQATIRRITEAARPDAIIGTNTSAIPIRTLAESAARPENFLGVHWMNPSYFVPSVEVIPTTGTSPAAVAAVEELLAAAKKVATRVSDSAGFVANRLQFALFKEAVAMVDEGLATPEEVDEVVSNAFGFRLAVFGPFAIADIAGLDVYEGSFQSMEATYGERLAAPELLKKKVAEGKLGLKTGGGFLPLDRSAAEDIANYRDRAYFELNELKKRLGPAPLKRREY